MNMQRCARVDAIFMGHLSACNYVVGCEICVGYRLHLLLNESIKAGVKLSLRSTVGMSSLLQMIYYHCIVGFDISVITFVISSVAGVRSIIYTTTTTTTTSINCTRALHLRIFYITVTVEKLQHSNIAIRLHFWCK